MKRTARCPRLTGLLIAFTLLGASVAGCSSDGSSDSTSTRSAADAPQAARERSSSGSDVGAAADSLTSSVDGRVVDLTDPGSRKTPASVISTGTVALRSTDVAQARFDVQKVVDRYRGEVTQEQTDTDDEGEIRRSRLVVRIPTADFVAAKKDLEEAADLISSDSATDDVTTEVIDIEARLRVQRRSVARIATLLDRAQSISDIVAIEGQLSRRQAVLGSLERQQAYLADQTAMSTITVSLERTKEKVVEKQKEQEETGFLAGLHAGWDGLTTVAVGLATVVGVLLPFLVVFLVLLVPGWPLARWLRRRRTTSAPAEA